MNVYVCTDHDGYYPVGVASVVIAPTEDVARQLLDTKLGELGLKGSDEMPYTLRLIEAGLPHAVILNDGNY